jgi:hypothetical protein
MAIAFVQTGANGVTNAGSVAVTLTGVGAGNFLVSAVSILQASTTAQAAITPTDTQGTWTDVGSDALILDTPNGVRHGSMGAFQTNVASGSHTVTYTFPNGVTYAELSVSEFSGMATASVLDLIAKNAEQPTATPLPVPSAGTTASLSQADELIVVAGEWFDATGSANKAISSPPSSYTALHAQQNSSTTVGAQHSYKIVASTSGVNVSWSWSGGGTDDDSAGLLMAFKAATAAALEEDGQAIPAPRPVLPLISLW